MEPALLSVPEGSDYTSDLHPDWTDLKQTRDALDAAIEQRLAAMPPEFLTCTMRYANTNGVQCAHHTLARLTCCLAMCFRFARRGTTGLGALLT